MYETQSISKDKSTFNFLTDILFACVSPKVHSAMESFENFG